MPRVSEFYGNAVYLYYAGHNPPHFHAIYGGQQVEVAIRTGEAPNGALPKRATRLVRSGPTSTRRNCWRTGTGHGRGSR